MFKVQVLPLHSQEPGPERGWPNRPTATSQEQLQGGDRGGQHSWKLSAWATGGGDYRACEAKGGEGPAEAPQDPHKRTYLSRAGGRMFMVCGRIQQPEAEVPGSSCPLRMATSLGRSYFPMLGLHPHTALALALPVPDLLSFSAIPSRILHR